VLRDVKSRQAHKGVRSSLCVMPSPARPWTCLPTEQAPSPAYTTRTPVPECVSAEKGRLHPSAAAADSRAPARAGAAQLQRERPRTPAAWRPEREQPQRNVGAEALQARGGVTLAPLERLQLPGHLAGEPRQGWLGRARAADAARRESRSQASNVGGAASGLGSGDTGARELARWPRKASPPRPPAGPPPRRAHRTHARTDACTRARTGGYAICVLPRSLLRLCRGHHGELGGLQGRLFRGRRPHPRLVCAPPASLLPQPRWGALTRARACCVARGSSSAA